MEAVCTQCQMRYEVGKELLQQGTPILCPTCQVSLTMVHPGTTIPLDQPLDQDPDPQSPDQEPQTADAAESGEPATGWDSGDLLGAGTDPAAQDSPVESQPPSEPEPPPEPEGAPAAAPASPSEELSGWGEPLPPEPPSPEPPEEPPPEQEAAQEPQAEEMPETPAATAPAFPEPELDSEPVEEPSSPEPPPPGPEPAFPEPEVSTGPEAPEPGDPPVESPAWPAQTAGSSSFETPTWEASPVVAPEPTAPEPATPEAAPPAPGEASPPAPGEASPPAPGEASPPAPGAQPATPDDWASAAARWAASGFSTENMPDFVRAKEEGQAASTAAPQVPDTTFTPPSQPSPAQAEISPTPPFAENPPPSAEAQQPQQPSGQEVSPPATPAVTPPPLPSPGPPPLEGRQKSVYVMKGSGEGVTDESAPWAQAPATEEPPPAQPLPVSAPAEPPARAQLDLSAPVEEPSPSPPSQVEVPKPGHTGLWIVLALVLIGAGGYLAYYFVTKSRQLDSAGQADDRIEKAGVAGEGQPDKPPVTDSSATGDAGQADAGKKPESKAQETVVKKDGKKPAGADKKSSPGKKRKRKRKKKRKRKVASSKESAREARKQALEFYKQGNALIRKRDYPAAIKLFKKALKANPKLALAHRGLGICYAQRRQNKRACREYRIYLKMIPPDSKEVPALRQILKGCK